MRFLILTIILILFPCALPGAGHAEKKKGGFVNLGGPSIDLDNKIVAVPVELVNLKGGLEFVLCHGNTKAYESLLATTVKGEMIHFAMLSAGFDASSFSGNTELDLDKQLAEQAKTGSRLEISVLFDGAKETSPLSSLLLWGSGNALKENRWFFAGSFLRLLDDGSKSYAANETLCIIASYPALSMVIGPGFPVENPYDPDASSFLMPNQAALPSLGARGTLFIRSAGDGAPEKDAAPAARNDGAAAANGEAPAKK